MTAEEHLASARLRLTQLPISSHFAVKEIDLALQEIALLRNALALARVSAGMVRAELAPANGAAFPPLVGDA